MTNSEARKRAQEAASVEISGVGAPNSPSEGPSGSGWQIDPQAICQCGANGWHICPNDAPVDSGAIGRLNKAEGAALLLYLDQYDTDETTNEVELYAAVERIVREHTDRALAEVEQRLAKAWDEGAQHVRGSRVGCWSPNCAQNPYRAARQEQGR